MGYWNNGSDDAATKADLQREITSCQRGFWILRDKPEWETSLRLTKQVYKWLNDLPERYEGYRDQMERAVVSIGCNIGEANGRSTLPQTLQYTRIARGSLWEVRTMLLVAPVEVPKEVLELADKCCRELDASVLAMSMERLDRLG